MLEVGALMLIAGVIGGGVLGALIRAWSWHSLQTSLTQRVLAVEAAIEDLRANLLTEVKRRAGEARAATRRTQADDQQELAGLLRKTAPPDVEQWWWRAQ